MSFDVNLAGTSIPTDVSTLQSFQNDLNLAFALDATLKDYLTDTLGNLPANLASSKISYSPSAPWAPSAGPVTFSLTGGASASFEILTSGSLLNYTDGLDNPTQASIPLPTGKAYTRTTLSFNISATADAAYSGPGGVYGVKGSVAAGASFQITFCKAFDLSTSVQTAIAQSFTGFVLPLHANTLTQMNIGDFILYDFDGNLHLSFGAYAGLDQVLYAGKGSADVIKAFGSPLATVSASTSPEIKLGANLGFTLDYTHTFQVVLSKPSASAAKLHLFRADKTVTDLAFQSGLTFNADTEASIKIDTTAVQAAAVNAVGGSTSAVGGALGQVISAATSEIDKYVGDVNDKLSSWLAKANGLQCNLQAAIETSSSSTLLVGYNFDLTATQPILTAAWDFATNGDFVQAFNTGAVTLDAGSGLQQEYQRKTSFSANLFNLGQWSSWSEVTTNSSFVYAGNNVFHLIAKADLQSQSSSVGAMRSIDFYFNASADANKSGVVTNTKIDLNLSLTAQGDAKAMGRIAAFLNAIEAGPAADTLAATMRTFIAGSAAGTVQLNINIPASAYANIIADPVNSPPTHDSANYDVFAQAADTLNAWALTSMATVSDNDLAMFKTYQGWVQLNEAATGGSTPDRTHTGNATIWPPAFPGTLDIGDQSLIRYSMFAGQQFMNFCASLQTLYTTQSVTDTDTSWRDIINMIDKAIKDYVSVDFVRVTALATVLRCNSANISAQGPNATDLAKNSFAVTLTL